ncbi:transglycosylase domain-containing protein [Luedemannella helvata]|uniref:transglycosylase domain-containing protein n=1 Tax=Luedemannella helvata TaxID=349315 RepID=UPI0031D03087
MRTPVLNAVARSAPLIRVGIIAGIAVAAIAFPLAAVGTIGAKTAAGFVESLPAEVRMVPPAQTSYLYAADGRTLITQFYEEYRKFTPYGQISPNMVNAIVASEDSRFYEHDGVDVKGVVRAFVANQRAGEVAQGASTLTMQYVRNIRRDSAESPDEIIAATAQTHRRKLEEIKLAVAIEQRMTKQQILEGYLNVAYFGHRAYGIYAAAEVYFSKRPRQLTVPEAAMLAGLVKAPSAYDPARDGRAARERRDYVIGRMVELGYVPAAQAAKLTRQGLGLRLSTPPNDCVGVNPKHNNWGYFCDMFKNWWRQQRAFGDSPSEREENLRRGGYRIVSSLMPRIQQVAFREVKKQQKIGTSFAHGVVALQPGTGRIVAAAVNRVYSLNQKHNGSHSDPRKRGVVPSNYPNTVNPLLGGGDMPGYQAGSTFKIFTMVAALDQGLPLTTSFYSPMRLKSIYPADWNDPRKCGDRWCPQNASKGMTGRQTMWSGFGKSVNTYFVQLEQRIGADRAVRMAERLGLRWRTDVDRWQASPARASGWGSFTLGVADTTPLEMANAYATIAADGRYCTPIPVRSITDLSGKELTEASTPDCRQAVSVQAARAAVDAARCVTGYKAATGPCGDWSTAPQVHGIVGRPVAGKTGTTDDTRAAWFVGMTPGLAAASFIADPDYVNHKAGDWNSWKPIQTVAVTLRDGLGTMATQYFTPPSGRIIWGSAGPGWNRPRITERAPRRR